MKGLTSAGRRLVHGIVIATLLLTPGLFIGVAGALAAPIAVNTFLDDTAANGNCTLREAIIAANTNAAVDACPAGGSGVDTIALPPGTYQLTLPGAGEDAAATGDLDILGDLRIAGAGAGSTTIDATGLGDRVFHVLAGTAGISGVKIKGGTTTANGGGIPNAATLTVTAVRVLNNPAGGSGGGIANQGGLTVARATIGGNAAGNSGGCIFAYTGPGAAPTKTIDVTQSAIVNNTAGPGTATPGKFGGGVANFGNSVVTITNSTISSNRAADSGAGIYNDDYDLAGTANDVKLTNATISHNTGLIGTGGILNAGRIDSKGTLVALNMAAPGPDDCRSSGTQVFNSLDFNLIQNGGCQLSGAVANNKTGKDPLLGPLQYNGGETVTRALLRGSPAIDAIPAGNCPATDQRGYLRPASKPCDIGAYEVGGLSNDSWIRATRLDMSANDAVVEQSLDQLGQAVWFKFQVQPGSRVVAQLTNLPANYDLTLYKDVSAAFDTLTSPPDLLRLGAEFAPDAFSPDAFSPDAFSPDAFTPDAFAPDACSPDAFSPDAFSPDAFSPDAFSPDAFSPDAFSSAQTRSLLGVSAFDGTTSEGIAVNTWSNDGDFYVRVRGRNGAYSPGANFRLEVSQVLGSCGTVSPVLPSPSLAAAAGGYQTIILTNPGRLAGSDAEKSALQAKLATFAARPEVKGVVVDVSADARVAAADAQANGHLDCPYAKNLVAGAIKDVVDRYRATGNPLQYVVIVGNDGVIPFFRHPDQALLGSERNFAPPVRDTTASQASLKLGYVLSKDRYGAGVEISLGTGALPLPDLAVGRLVETAPDIAGLLDAYLGTTSGVVATPASSLVTGYDFLADAARAVQAELQAGTGRAPDSLITDRDVSPLDPRSWTADQLRAALLGSRHDLIFLAGHFSAGSALAADYRTRLLTTDLAASTVDLTNVIAYSAGCHAGYNTVDPDSVTGVTAQPDWPQAFARKRATLIAGTGYQYGDNDFIEYSERLYLDFSKQLRAGSGPIAVGKALVAAKQDYQAATP